jgi:endonuclease/exonuclease/phosphatase family metal-dependent hydrolase
MSQRLRVVTYNIHKCRGLDRKVSPRRIADVLLETRADVMALQEVLHQPGCAADQLGAIAAALDGVDWCFGENRKHRGAGYGNAVLSRFAIRDWKNYDLTWRRERRGALRADIDCHGRLVHLFNIHLGTSYLERRVQARKLVSADVLLDADLSGSRLVLGDFNEWTRGLTTRMLSAHLHSVDVRKFLGRRRTYPGVLPLLHLDHIYFDGKLKLADFSVHRSRAALLASDHLPLVADFTM